MPTQKLTKPIIEAAILGFESQKNRLTEQIAELRAMLDGTKPAATPVPTPRKRRKFSAATRRKMATAQKARWVKLRGESEPSAPATPESPKAKRKLSAAGRRAIQEALRRRWAQKRAEAKRAQSATTKKAAPVQKNASVKKAAVKRPRSKAAKKSRPVKRAAVKKPTTKTTATAAAETVTPTLPQ